MGGAGTLGGGRSTVDLRRSLPRYSCSILDTVLSATWNFWFLIRWKMTTRTSLWRRNELAAVEQKWSLASTLFRIGKKVVFESTWCVSALITHFFSLCHSLNHFFSRGAVLFLMQQLQLGHDIGGLVSMLVSAHSILSRGSTCLLISVYIFDHVKKDFFFIHDDIRRHAVELLSSWWVGETSALLKETCGCLSFEILWILNRCRSVIVWVCSKFPVLFFPQLSNWNNVWILYVGGNIVSSTGLCNQLQTLWM